MHFVKLVRRLFESPDMSSEHRTRPWVPRGTVMVYGAEGERFGARVPNWGSAEASYEDRSPLPERSTPAGHD